MDSCAGPPALTDGGGGVVRISAVWAAGVESGTGIFGSKERNSKSRKFDHLSTVKTTGPALLHVDFDRKGIDYRRQPLAEERLFPLSFEGLFRPPGRYFLDVLEISSKEP